MRAQWERKRQETGQALGYFGCHRRVRKERGRAADQICACGKQARHWAHMHGTDPEDPQNYQAMCIPCHYKYDDINQRRMDTLGPEGRSATARLAWSRRSPEQRQEIGDRIAQNKDHVKASQAAKQVWARRTPEERQELTQKLADARWPGRRVRSEAAPPPLAADPRGDDGGTGVGRGIHGGAPVR